jgi:L-seryl-tRNA(Ser) seleniumtransferase
MTVRRLIPSIDLLLQRPALAAAIRSRGHERVAEAVRRAALDLRAATAEPTEAPEITDETRKLPETSEEVAAWLEAHALEALDRTFAPSLRRVINATGVLLHTNLGRAPLAADALARVQAIAAGYSNLEYDVDAGARGHRRVHAERLLSAVTGAQAALVVNNNAAGLLLALAALAAGREVLVSRGELVEIGGGFRVPEILAQSGATLREVGTTNRTRVSDYAAALGDRTGLVLRVHPSNFRLEGFTERAKLADLVALCRRFDVPLLEDLGSGWLGAAYGDVPALADEPSVGESLTSGADLVAFSGDKLLGGPQCGILCGRRALVDRLARHPLMRALRVGKMTYAALEATLLLWASPTGRERLPLHRMLSLTVTDLDPRVRHLAASLTDARGLRASIIDGVSTTGGGSAPQSSLPTRLLAIEVQGLSAAALETRLRQGQSPIVARIQDDVVVMDLRTVLPEEDEEIVRAIVAVVARLGF